jgi:hypothetical protein
VKPPKGPGQDFAHVDRARPAGFRWLDPPGGERPLDSDPSFDEIQVGPPEREGFAWPLACVRQEDKQRYVGRGVLLRRRKEDAELLLGHRSDVSHLVGHSELARTASPAPAEAERGVGQDDAVVHRFGEDHREGGPDHAHAC